MVTSYQKSGKHTYRVERVDFQKNVNDTLTITDRIKKTEREVSFKQYY